MALTENEKKKRTAAYTPINSYAYNSVDTQQAYRNEVAKQNDYIAANPTAVQTMTQAEKYDKYGDIMDATAQSGYYTRDYDEAMRAQAQYGVDVTPTTYRNGEQWYLVDRAERTTQEGASGADEGLMNDDDYAIIQSLKDTFSQAQSSYNAALAAGDSAAAADYQAIMDQAHLEAERIRAGYNYSGGQDGSMYIDYSVAAMKDLMPIYTAQTQRYMNAKGATSALGSWVTGDVYGTGGTASGSGSAGSSGTANGSGTGSDSGSAGTAGSGLTVPGLGDLSSRVEDYSDYLQQMYAAQKAAQLAQLQAAYEQNLAELERSQSGVADAYQAARNRSAAANEQAKRNFAQYAAANGLNNGTSGQAELARSVTQQNDQNAINIAEADTLADLQLQRANAETEYNSAIAKAEATGDYELAYALYQEKVRVQEALMEAEIQQQKYALEQYQLQYQAGQNSAKTLAAYGEAWLNMGIMPSAEMLAAMGITEDDARRYLAAAGAQ